VLQSEHSIVTTRLDAGGLTDGQRAGLAMFGQGISWIGVTRRDGVSRVTFSSAGVESPGPVLTSKTLSLRVEVADQTARYSYSLDGGKSFVALGAPAPLRFSWWKGARPALFTYGDPGQPKQGVADFDWVTVKPAP
jgi:beta-xylosidase